MTVLAGAFGWPPSELDALDAPSFLYWLERAREWAQWQRSTD
jgi:hypothetical protein